MFSEALKLAVDALLVAAVAAGVTRVFAADCVRCVVIAAGLAALASAGMRQATWFFERHEFSAEQVHSAEEWTLCAQVRTVLQKENAVVLCAWNAKEQGGTLHVVHAGVLATDRRKALEQAVSGAGYLIRRKAVALAVEGV